jgi:hypothetical protein
MTRVRFEILSGDEWVLVTRAQSQPSGWLHWEKRTKDGTEVGLAQPGKWRAKEIVKGKKK